MTNPTQRIVQPEGWPRPKGYSNGMAAQGEFLAIAGMVGWDANEQIVSPDFLPQFRQALENVVAVVRSAGGAPDDIINITVYVTDKQAYIDDIRNVGACYREIIGRHFPAMALVQVAALLEVGAQVEVQAMAVLPAPDQVPS